MLTHHPTQPPWGHADWPPPDNPNGTPAGHKPLTLVAGTRPGFIDEVDALPIHDNRPNPHPGQTITTVTVTRAHRSFVASSPAVETRPVRRVLFGWSIVIALVAQGLIGATVAVGGNPVIGAAATVGLTTCTLLLIAAEYVTARTRTSGWGSAARMPGGRDRQVAGPEGKRRRRFRPNPLGNGETSSPQLVEVNEWR